MATRIIISCICLVMMLSACDQISPETKIQSHRERAKNYFDKGQYSEALIEYKNISQINPNDANAHYQLALIYIKLGGGSNLQQAFSELTKTVDLDKSNSDAHLKLGEFYLLNNKPRDAREHANIVLATISDHADGLSLKARSLLQEQRYDEGIAELKKALPRAPQNTRLYIDLARVYSLKKDPAAAEAILQDGLAANPRSIELLVAFGDYRKFVRQPGEAEALYKQALDLAPENDGLHTKLASLYLMTGRWNEAESIYQRLVSAKPETEQPHILLGDYYEQSGQPDKAFASYQQAIKINPESSIARDKLITHHLDTGNTAEAESLVKTIIERDKKSLAGRFFTARLHLTRLEVDEAVTLLQGVIKEEPKFAEAHYFYGAALLQKQQVAQARGEIIEAVTLAPEFADAHIALSAVHLSEGSWDLAIEQAQTALKLNPRKVQAALTLGEALLRKGDKTKSRLIFEQLAAGMPSNPIGPYKLGMLARREKNESRAIAYFEEALKRQPRAIEPLAEISAIHLSHGKVVDARERVLQQMKAVPGNALLYNLLGQLWLASKDAEQAAEAFKNAVKIDSSLMPAYMSLGSLYQEAGKHDQAITEFEAVLAKDPRNVQAYVLLGTLYEMRKEHDKAITQYQSALKIDSKLAPAANNLAWILAEQGKDLDVALSYAQTARHQRPDDPNIADTLGWIYVKKKAYLLAIEQLKEASEKLPQDPIVQFHYGIALYKNGDVAKAKRALEASLKLDPNHEGSQEAHKILVTL